MDVEILTVEEEDSGERLDTLVSESFNHLSRTMVQNLIKQGNILVDGKPVKPSYRVKENEEVKVIMPELEVLQVNPENIPLEILYEDEDLAVVNKPKGLVVHPAHGNWEGTLVNALLYHIKDLSGINGKLRPGIVHRLDKDTSGVLVVAKNDQAHRSLAEQIKEHSIKREYIALVHGNIKENAGVIDAPIGRSKTDRKKMAVVKEGRPAISEYEVLERFASYTLVKVNLLTGRTHQIRVHFAYIKHPVVGDPLYGSGKRNLGLASQALHAHLLGIVHPRTGCYMEFTSPLPEPFQMILKELREKH